jgi:hypothetical protein
MRSSRPSSASSRARPVIALLGIVAIAGALGACSTAATPAPTAAASVTVSGAWVRVAATTGAPTAAYLVIANAGAQAATMVEIHETKTDMSGMTGMSPIDRLPIPAGGTATLQPGGFHLMLTGLKAPLAAGATVELDLVFEHAGKVVVQAEVRAG